MTNLLRKFRDLVFEVDDNDTQAGSTAPKSKGGPATSGEEVLAAIEKIRSDLENEGHTDFEDKEEPGSGVRSPGDNSAAGGTDGPHKEQGLRIKLPPTVVPDAGTLESGGSTGFNVPKLLSIAEVYTRAQIAEGPGHVDKINDMLNDPEMEGLSMDIRARSVKMALKASGIGLESILEDAGRRDQALEDYTFFLEKKLEQIRSQVEADNLHLQQEIDEFVKQKQNLMEINRRNLEEAGRVREEFKTAKQAEEKRLYDIVTPFVSPGENPVELT